MKRVVTALVALSILSMPAAAQVRPGDCRPILPVLDKAAEVIPNVVTPQAEPVVPAKRRFLGLPFLLPLIAAGGGCAAFCGGNHHHTEETPPPVSPA
jgi:hypothetical protein